MNATFKNKLKAVLENAKKKNLRTWNDGESIWYESPAKDMCPGFTPDRMAVPKEITDIDRGSSNRKVIRQYHSPCPLTGKVVLTRELEGGVYCWINPELESGVIFSFRPGATTDNCKRIDGDYD